MLKPKDIRVANYFGELGDTAGIMEIFGVKRVSRYSIRTLAARAVTIEQASRRS